MPLRPLNREQAWLLPPTLGELIPDDHPARFVAAFVDALDRPARGELGIGLDGEPRGAPAYRPRALLSVWLHGFMDRDMLLPASWRQLAASLNEQGYRTKNTHKLPDDDGSIVSGPRVFTMAWARSILHNSFYMGKVRHRDHLLPGSHEALLSEEVFPTVQAAMKRNSGRSEILQPHPEREYLLKGLIRCIHCGMPMWAQTYKNGNRYYREQYGSRGSGYCVGRSSSLPCHIPDQQMGRIMGAIVLPAAWLDRVLARVHLPNERERVEQERKETEGRLKRLAQTYVDNLIPQEDYQRQKNQLQDRLGALIIPGVDAAQEAGKLLENLPRLWEQADLGERRRILLTMLEAVYVDPVEAKSVVAIRPKPAFQALFEIATTREGNGVVLTKEEPPGDGQEAPCSWWRRGRVELYLKRGLAVCLVANLSWPSSQRYCLEGISQIRRLPLASFRPRLYIPRIWYINH